MSLIWESNSEMKSHYDEEFQKFHDSNEERSFGSWARDYGQRREYAKKPTAIDALIGCAIVGALMFVPIVIYLWVRK